jgi:hypothetical protein
MSALPRKQQPEVHDADLEQRKGAVSRFMARLCRPFNAAARLGAAKGCEVHLKVGGTMRVTRAVSVSAAELGIPLAETTLRDSVHAITSTDADLEEDRFDRVASSPRFAVEPDATLVAPLLPSWVPGQ